MFPKRNLYQRLHICAKPYYSDTVPKEIMPNFIIPPKSTEHTIEYQVCLKDEEEFAEHGKASHTGYKDRIFHRLAIPIILSYDPNLQKARLGRLDESMQDFYGYSFESLFNIEYQRFLHTFDTQQRDEILAGKLQINLDKDTNEYVLTPATRTLIVGKEQNAKFIQNLLKNATKEQLERFYEINGLLDGTIYPQNSDSHSTRSPKIKLYSHSTPTTKTIPIVQTFKNILKKAIGKEQKTEAQTPQTTSGNGNSQNFPEEQDL